jgi:pyrroline-5-carboxylate reductase
MYAHTCAHSRHSRRIQAHIVTSILRTVGSVHRVAETDIDAVCGVSGSGPAYVYTMIDAMSDGAVKMGLARPLATHLAAQTVMVGHARHKCTMVFSRALRKWCCRQVNIRAN